MAYDYNFESYVTTCVYDEILRELYRSYLEATSPAAMKIQKAKTGKTTKVLKAEARATLLTGTRIRLEEIALDLGLANAVGMRSWFDDRTTNQLFGMIEDFMEVCLLLNGTLALPANAPVNEELYPPPPVK